MKKINILAVFFIVAFLTGCSSTGGPMPKSFSHISSPGWKTIEVRKEIGYDNAWSTLVNILVRNFEIDKFAKEEGYIRTCWLHTWSGTYQANYRVRVTAKFSDNRKQLEIKPTAQYLSGVNWLTGVDTQLISTLKSDLMGTLSRTTR